MSDMLTSNPHACLEPLRQVIEALAAEGVVPASINVEWRHTDRTHPYVNFWLRYRTDLECLADRLGLRVESVSRVVGQRHYFTKGDGPGVLLQAVSHKHHDDWLGPITSTR